MYIYFTKVLFKLKNAKVIGLTMLYEFVIKDSRGILGAENIDKYFVLHLF